jgi:TRAP-type uncharacterized transport system substrate-binding protein
MDFGLRPGCTRVHRAATQIEALLSDPISQGDAVTVPSLSNQGPVHKRQFRGRRAWLGLAIVIPVLVIAIALCVYTVSNLLRSSATRSHRVQMTTDISRRNVELADQIREEATRHRLEIVPTANEYGTLEALEAIDSPSEVKLALIIGGVTARKYPHVRTVTSLTKEHLHLLVKSELADGGVAELHGKRIFLGPPTTASHHVARDVLAFVGLHPAVAGKDGGYIIDSTPREQALRELVHIESLEEPARTEAIARLPDAVMVLAPLPSPFVKPLVAQFGYRLIPLPFAEAYGIDNLNPPSLEGVRIERSMLTSGVIPAYAYGSRPAEPAQDCPTMCFPLVLITRDDVDREVVSILLQIIYDSRLKSVIRPPALDDQVNAFPRHAGTEHYLHRRDPLLTPEVASRLAAVAGGTGAFLSGMIAFYGFLRLRKLNRFESYYREIGQIEMVACGLQEDPTAPTDVESLRASLEGRLTALKCRVLEDFAEGGMRGEALMAGIIALINDTRESLAGMAASRNGTICVPTDDAAGTGKITKIHKIDRPARMT